MHRKEMAERLNARGAWLPGKRVKFDFGAEGVVMLDGVAERVTEEDGPADTIIRVSWENWQRLRSGELGPMMAVISGKLKLEGDKSNAIQLQSVLEKLNR